MGIMDSLQDAFSEAMKAGEPLEQLIKDDDVAGKTAWTAVNSPGSASTHKFQQVSPTRIEFKPDLPALLKPTFLTVVIVGGMFTIMTKMQELEPVILYSLPVFALITAAVTANKFYRGLTPVVFDRTTGYYWKSRQQPGRSDTSEDKNACRIDDIYAIQLIRKSVSTGGSGSGGGSGISYQLNLVKKDGNRLNVTSSRNKSQLELNTEELSTFLNVPVWNFSTYTAM